MAFGLIEQVTHAAGTYADEHFYKFRTGDREKWYTSFTGNGFSHQSFTCPRRPY